jgi:hypothetical protein
MNSPERHFRRYMDHDWGDGTLGRDDRVLYTCEEDGPDGPLYDEHFQPIGVVSPEKVASDERAVGIETDDEPVSPTSGPITLSYRKEDATITPVATIGGRRSGVSDPEGSTPSAPPPITLSYRRGSGLNLSWAILSRGGEVVSEEPISHDLCDTLIRYDDLVQSAMVVLRHEIIRSGWEIIPEQGLGAVLMNLCRARGVTPWEGDA